MKWTSLYYGQFSWSDRYQTSYNHHLYNTDSSPLRTVTLVPHGDTKIHTIVTFLIRTPVLSPPQRPLCVVGRLGRKKKRARGARWEVSLYRSSPARFLFFSIILFWWGYPAGASAEERGHLSITDSSHGPRDANLQKNKTLPRQGRSLFRTVLKRHQTSSNHDTDTFLFRTALIVPEIKNFKQSVSL